MHHPMRAARLAASMILTAAMFAALALSPARANTIIESDVALLETAAPHDGSTRTDAWNRVKDRSDFRSEFGWNVPDLDTQVVTRYSQYVTLRSDGTFKADIPAELFFTDPKGAWATTNAVIQANTVVVKQLELLAAKGYPVQLEQYVYGQALPMGAHATFTPLWWGMTFTFDAVATQQINVALTMADAGLSVVSALSGVGVIMSPPVGAIVGAVALGLKMSISMTKKCMTQHGLVIKSLWLPIPWCEKPTKAFVPALSYESFGQSGAAKQNTIRIKRPATTVENFVTVRQTSRTLADTGHHV